MYLAQVEDPSNPLVILKNAILEKAVYFDASLYYILTTGTNNIVEIWENSEYKKITGKAGLSDTDCGYIAIAIRDYVGADRGHDDYIFSIIKNAIGEKPKSSILSLINTALICTFAFIGFKIFRKGDK